MVPPQTQVQAPVRSLDQRMEALKRANDIRVKRAQLKKDLKSGRRLDRADPPRAARVRLDREGLRHADGGAEVRPREGCAPAQPVPHQPVEDGRRPLRPPAARADWPLQPPLSLGAAPVFVVTGPSGAGKGTLIQLVLPRFAELALAVSATTRPQRPGEEDGVHYWFLDARGVRPAGRGGRVPRVGRLRRKPLRDAQFRDRPAARRTARRRCSSSRPRARCASSGGSPGAVTIFVTAPVDELERRLRERATESSGVIEERVDDGARSSSTRAAASSTTWSRTTIGSVPQSASRRSSPGSSTVPLPWRGNDPSPHR